VKYVLTYGLLSGFVIILVLIAGLLLGGQEGVFATAVFGYLVMLVAMTFIFVGVKRYRDVELGGVVKFGRAFALGLGIALVAGAVYVLVWEAYLALTDYAFIDQYIDGALRAKKKEGVTAEALAAYRQEMETMRVQYANPLIRLPMTFLEVFPVGLLVAILSAALLRKPNLFPARA
jgi:hypothetical protein